MTPAARITELERVSDTPLTDAVTFDHPLGFKIVHAEECKRLERVLKVAEEALNEASGSTSYSSHEDSIGYHTCCGSISYDPHTKGCYLSAALTQIKGVNK